MKQRILTAFLIVTAIMALFASMAHAESLTELKAKLDKVAAEHHGTLGYSLDYRGKHPEKINLRGDDTFPTASTIKTTIMCETMHQIEQGKVKWDQQLPVQASTDDRQPGGFAYYFKEGTTISIGEWVHLMITVSDNTATMNLREFLGQKNVNDWLDAHGFKTTRLLNGKKCDELGLRPLQQKWGLGMTSPNEMVKLFAMILDNKAGSPASCERMQRLLTHQYWDDFALSQIPPNVHAGAKTGAINRTRSDVMFVDSPGGQYILAVYTKDNEDQSWKTDNEAQVAIRTISALVWKHYNPKSTWEAPKGWENLLPSDE